MSATNTTDTIRLPTAEESQWVTVRSRKQRRAAAKAAAAAAEAATTQTTPQKTIYWRTCSKCKQTFDNDEGFMWYCDMDCASADGLFKAPYW